MRRGLGKEVKESEEEGGDMRQWRGKKSRRKDNGDGLIGKGKKRKGEEIMGREGEVGVKRGR